MTEKLEELRESLYARAESLTREDYLYVDPRLTTSQHPDMGNFYAAVIPMNDAVEYSDQTLMALSEFKMHAILARALARDYEHAYGPQSEEFLRADFYYSMQIQKFYDTANLYMRSHKPGDLIQATGTALTRAVENNPEELAELAQRTGLNKEQFSEMKEALTRRNPVAGDETNPVRTVAFNPVSSNSIKP